MASIIPRKFYLWLPVWEGAEHAWPRGWTHCDEAALHGGRTWQCPAGSQGEKRRGYTSNGRKHPHSAPPQKGFASFQQWRGCGPILLHIGLSGTFQIQSIAFTKAEFLSNNKKYLLKDNFFYFLRPNHVPVNSYFLVVLAGTPQTPSLANWV